MSKAIQPKYSSDELNKKIEQSEDQHGELEVIGGKIIPYLGWYWRRVNFDSKTYNFGIIDDDPEGFVGFCENNKWNYPLTDQLKPEEWAQVRYLLERLVDNPNKETVKDLWDYIQSFRGDV